MENEKHELVELFCSRISLEQRYYKKRILKMSSDVIFDKSYEINCMVSIYETLMEKAEKMEADILKCLIVLPDILRFFYRKWMKIGDSFQQELEDSMESSMKGLEELVKKPKGEAA